MEVAIRKTDIGKTVVMSKCHNKNYSKKSYRNHFEDMFLISLSLLECCDDLMKLLIIFKNKDIINRNTCQKINSKS